MARKKYTYQEVCFLFSERGYILLDDTYKNSKEKLKFSCNKCNNEHSVSLSNLRKGQGCLACKGIRKINIEIVKEEFETRGYVLLSEVYVNDRTNLEYICPAHPDIKNEIRYDNFKQGKGCRLCGVERTSNKSRHTLDFVIKAIEEDGYDMLSNDYINSHDKLDLKCPNGHFISMPFTSWKTGRRCGFCAKNRISIGQIEERLKEKGITLVSEEYIDSKKDLKLICEKGHKFSANWVYLRKNPRCRVCVGQHFRSNMKKDIKEIYKDVINEGYKFITWLEIYKNNRSKFIVRCDKDHLWETDGARFSSGVRCKKCANHRLSLLKTLDINIEQLRKDVTDIGYTPLFDSYKNSFDKMKMQCDKGHIIYLSRRHLMMGVRCGKCSKTKPLTHKEFVNRVFSLTQDEYTVEGKYKNAKTKIKMKHNRCGHVYGVVPNSFTRGRRCPKCRSSKGESIIMNSINFLKTPFVRQKKFKKCKHIHSLPFDFYIDNKILIEYDGEQHFYKIDFSGKGVSWAEENLAIIQYRDKIKNKYCIDNNFPLLRIPYWEFDNIESILESTLMNYNIIEKTESYELGNFQHYIVDEDWDHDAYVAKCPKNQKEALKVIDNK